MPLIGLKHMSDNYRPAGYKVSASTKLFVNQTVPYFNCGKVTIETGLNCYSMMQHILIFQIWCLNYRRYKLAIGSESTPRPGFAISCASSTQIGFGGRVKW